MTLSAAIALTYVVIGSFTQVLCYMHGPALQRLVVNCEIARVRDHIRLFPVGLVARVLDVFVWPITWHFVLWLRRHQLRTSARAGYDEDDPFY